MIIYIAQSFISTSSSMVTVFPRSFYLRTDHKSLQYYFGSDLRCACTITAVKRVCTCSEPELGELRVILQSFKCNRTGLEHLGIIVEHYTVRLPR